MSTHGGDGNGIKVSSGLIGRAVTVVLQLAVFAAVLWMKQNFVSKTQYDADNKQTLQATIQIAKDSQHITDQLEAVAKLSATVEQLKEAVKELQLEHRPTSAGNHEPGSKR